MRDRSLDNQMGVQLQQQMIQPLKKRVFRFPFYGLRVWLFSLIALIGLPIGGMLMLVGFDMQENLNSDWEQVTATVRSNEDLEIRYAYDGENDEIIYELDNFATVPDTGEIALVASLCDLTAWLTIPDDSGATFSLWVNPDKPSQNSCVSISRDMGSMYFLGGIVLVILSSLRLLRTIASAAGNKPK
ncbi:MAG: DUF3592 domain-containing protein [Chloroflexota bacterium]